MKIIDRIQKRVCVHYNIADIKLLLHRNNLCDVLVKKYVTDVVANCRHFHSSAPPVPSSKGSISSLSKRLNDMLCVENLHLDSLCSVHFMDLVKIFSTAYIVETTASQDVTREFEKHGYLIFGIQRK